MFAHAWIWKCLPEQQLRHIFFFLKHTVGAWWFADMGVMLILQRKGFIISIKHCHHGLFSVQYALALSVEAFQPLDTRLKDQLNRLLYLRCPLLSLFVFSPLHIAEDVVKRFEPCRLWAVRGSKCAWHCSATSLQQSLVIWGMAAN